MQVDIDQSIQFIHHDVDVIRTNSGRDNRQAVSLVISGDGTELPVAFLDVYFLEIRGNHFYSGRVTHEDHLFCQIFGMKVEVKDTPVSVRDDCIGSIYCLLFEQPNLVKQIIPDKCLGFFNPVAPAGLKRYRLQVKSST